MKLVFSPFVYPGLTQPIGHLSPDMRAQACWYFYTLAQKLYEKLGNSTEDQFALLEDNLWMDPHYVQIARSVATQYGLSSPSEFAKAWDEVKLQAQALGFPEPKQVYMRLAPGIITLN